MSTEQDRDELYAPAPAGDDPSRGTEVWAPADGPFEAPAKEFVPGPYYADVSEKIPELAERDPVPQSTDARAKGKDDKTGFDRRDLLKFFSLAGTVGATSCIERPLELAIPYVTQPIDQFPGEPTYYASTCGECTAGCGVMVRTREGRPMKIEGLPDHPISNGKLCAVGQGSVQGLWHPERRHQPKIRFGNRMEPVTWPEVFEHLGPKLAGMTRIGIFTGGSTGNRHAFFKEFLERMGSSATRLYTWEPNTLPESITAAHQLAYGVAAIPRADLNTSKLIVGIGTDFLDVGVSPVFHTKSYSEMHAFKGGVKGRHVQFEAAYTITGARADERHVIPPGSETLATLLLCRSLLENKSAKGSAQARAQIQQVLEQKAELVSGGYGRIGIQREVFDKLASDLLSAPSVVMCGGSYNFDENATNLQLAAIMANELAGAYESVLQLQKGWMTPPVNPGDLNRFLTDAPQLEALFVIDSNPMFTLPASFGVKDLIAKIPVVVSIQNMPNEMDEVAHYQLNGHHYLEQWGDEQPVAGFWSARQPTVRVTTDSRQAEEVLMWLAATAKKPLGYSDYRDYLKKKWNAVYQMTGTQVPYDTFFDAVLHQGFAGKVASQAVGALSGNLAASFKYVESAPGGLRLIAPIDIRWRAGEHTHKPVMQETGDTLTTITWDTFVAISPATATKLGLRKYDVVKVEGSAGSFEGSVYMIPGLHPDVVVVPRGNGHAKGIGTIQGGQGVDPLVALAKSQDALTGAPVTAGQSVKLTAMGRAVPLAQIQKHNDIANRKDVVKKVSLQHAAANMQKTRNLDDVPDIFPKLPPAASGYKWGMAIDLTRCTGCQACYVACTIENNVPQVGREQILLGREMNWIKIDRYFYGDTEKAEVTLQPMLCQHCNHAPCEAVCPVYATTHDPEGINAMTYNRCIGTRYCANACPYKIRRFNWWTHKWNVIGERKQDRSLRALNPDVTVRTRGVMEKCTFCYQRVRDAKHRAKIRGTPLADGEVKTACQQTCPADAIVFGNLNDPSAAVTAMRKDHRSYLVLGGDPDEKEYGIKTLPSVSYLRKVTLGDPVEMPDPHAPHHHGAGHGEGGEHGEGAPAPAGGEHQG